MLRFFVCFTFALALLAAPAALMASGPAAVWGHLGSLTDPDGSTATAACDPATCGEQPTGGPAAVWGALGSLIDPNGSTATAACDPATCGEQPTGGPAAVWGALGSMSDPNGLTAAAPAAPGAFGQFLTWLRVLLPL